MADDTIPIPVIVKRDTYNGSYDNTTNDSYRNHNFRQSAYDPSYDRQNYYYNEYNHNYGGRNTNLMRNIGLAIAGFIAIIFAWILISSMHQSGSNQPMDSAPTQTVTVSPSPSEASTGNTLDEARKSAAPIIPTNVPTDANGLGKSAAKGAEGIENGINNFVNGFKEQMKQSH